MELARLSTSVTFQNRAEGGIGTEYFFDLGNNWGVENTYWEGGHSIYFVDGGDNWSEDTAQH